jgi:hypothetical protein
LPLRRLPEQRSPTTFVQTLDIRFVTALPFYQNCSSL